MTRKRPNLIQREHSAFIVEKQLSHAIVGCFYDAYNEFGFGLNERLYSRALEILLVRRGLRVEREYPVVVSFRGQQIGFYRLDMFVERRVLVEIKASEVLPDFARRQLRCYVNLAKVELGILLHFGPNPRFYRGAREQSQFN